MTKRYATKEDIGREFCAFNIVINLQSKIYKIEREQDTEVNKVGPDRNGYFAFNSGHGMPLTRVPLGVVVDGHASFTSYYGGIVDYAENEEAVIAIAKTYIAHRRNIIVSEIHKLMGVALNIGPVTILDV